MAKQRYFARPIRKSIDEVGYATYFTVIDVIGVQPTVDQFILA